MILRRADACLVRLLHIVRRTCILLRRGNVVVADALLGRFLPRLGPLVVTQAASLFKVYPLSDTLWDVAALFGSLWALLMAKPLDGTGQEGRDFHEVVGNPVESRAAAQAGFIHIKRPVDLDLHGMEVA